jgi:hypothetical protein
MKYHVLSRVVQISPDAHCVTVSAIPSALDRAEVRAAVVTSAAEAQARRDYLQMSLATELRARGHELNGIVE